MTERSPLVLKDGRIVELPKGDSTRGSNASAGTVVFPTPFEPLPIDLPDEMRFGLLATGLF